MGRCHFGLTVVLGVACAFGARADNAIWTGAGSDNKWTNPANWEGSVVPGWYTVKQQDGAVVTNGDLTLTAVFGPIATGSKTTVSLTGMVAISNITFAAGAPAYTLGTSITDVNQKLKLYNGGNLIVEPGVLTKQTIRYFCPLYKGPITACVTGSGSETCVWRHDGADELYIEKLSPTYNTYPSVYGTGTYHVCATYTGNAPLPKYYGGGRWIQEGSALMSGSYKSFTISSSSDGPARVEIPSGKFFNIGDTSTELPVIRAYRDVLFTGEGVFGTRCSHTTAKKFSFTVDKGVTVTVDVDMQRDIKAGTPRTMYLMQRGKGTLRILKTMDDNFNGDYYFAEDGGTVQFRKTSCLGLLNLGFAASGTFEWIGDGETSERVIGFTKTDAVGTLRNSGTGELVYGGTTTQSVVSATLALDAATAPITFNGTVAVKEGQRLDLKVLGSCPVKVADPSAFGKLILGAANLDLSEIEADTISFGQVNTVAAGAGLVVPDGKTVSVTGIGQGVDKATLDIVLPRGSTFKFVGHADGDLVDWVTVNGAKCYCKDGTLHPYLTEWKSAADGNWDAEENWADAVPTAKYTARIAAEGDYTVSVPDGVTATALRTELGTGTDGHTATLDVAGDASFAGMAVRKGGALAVDGGTLAISGPSCADFLSGGTVSVTNGGVLQLPQSAVLGTGLLTVEGPNSQLKGKNLTVRPAAAGETAHLVFRGAGQTNSLSGCQLLVGGTIGGTSVFDVNCAGEDKTTDNILGKDQTFNRMYVGYGQGCGEMNVTGGYMASGNYGVHVGTCASGATPIAGVCNPTGVLNVAGGRISYSGWGTQAERMYCGLIVGDGSLVSAPGNGTFCRGTVNLSGGTLVSNQGYVMLGVGQGEGELNQTGGTFTHHNGITDWISANYVKPDGTSNFVHDVYIGLAGGRGRYTITGGTASFRNRIFVGGAPTNDLCRATTAFLPEKWHDGTRNDGVGVLSLQGGTITSTTNVLVGCFGRGRVELGTNGKLTARTMILSNATEAVLSAQLGDAGFGTLSLTDRLVIADGAKLEIDARNLTRARGGLKRIVSAAAGVEGAFAAGDITILPPDDQSIRERVEKGSVIVDEGGIGFRLAPCGVLLIVR